MDTEETPEVPRKETRGRSGKTVRLAVELSMSDVQAALKMSGRRMGQLGEFVSIDRVISEAIQHFAKNISVAE